MTTLHQTTQSSTTLNNILKSITFYTWISAAVLFVGYVYFVGAITFSVITERGLQADTKALISSMGEQELEYLTTQKELTESYARERGFIEAETVSFAQPQRAFAWNVGR